VVPIVYTLLDDLVAKFSRKRKAQAQSPAVGTDSGSHAV
jgi:hypothetical protein